jgi:hypothetical protein
MMRHALAFAFLSSVAACTKQPTPAPDAPATVAAVPLPDAHPLLTPLPDPGLNGGLVGRAPRRISVSQLKQSIVTVTGVQWSQIDTLAASLGQADFALTVSDSLDPNLVFAKFLEDGAREVCLAAAKADLTRAPAQRVLWPELTQPSTDFTTVDDVAIARNLGTLATRFWGSSFEPSELTDWTLTFKKLAVRAKATNKPEQAWGSICVAMMTDSRFITY